LRNSLATERKSKHGKKTLCHALASKIAKQEEKGAEEQQ
jgi:hypothetical protein